MEPGGGCSRRSESESTPAPRVVPEFGCCRGPLAGLAPRLRGYLCQLVGCRGTHPMPRSLFDLHVGVKMRSSLRSLSGRDDLSMAYTPGVPGVQRSPPTRDDPHYTWVPNRSRRPDGRGPRLGDIGPPPQPVEGQGGRSSSSGASTACPSPRHQDTEYISRPSPAGAELRGINLEDISARAASRSGGGPAQGMLDIPSSRRPARPAVVALAALTNALTLTGRNPDSTGVSRSRAAASRGQDPAQLRYQVPRGDLTAMSSSRLPQA